PAPGYSMHDYTPSTVPGCRLPHLWLPDGQSLYDLLGHEFTLLRFDPTVDVEPLICASRRLAVPLKLLDLDFGGIPAPYRHALCIARPDVHIAWRADQLPAAPESVLATITGLKRNLPPGNS
ncbi:MAG TPA: hypothetical protein VI653_19125, partial [Steroidobacteraceae bacterium]